ncbi:MAG TPA: MBG domain-containing protein, partial [Candidatus Limnocylindrales bacterium]|nr:MBG domain-containing protein [Candidatus Limnocylindrales bacterium]
VPINGFAIDPVNSNVIYAGSDIGVFISTNGGASWNPFGSGLPRVAVFDMSFQNANRILKIATHGRGAWEIQAAKTVATVTLNVPATATYGDNVTFTATVGANGALATPGGTVTFSDGGLVLGTSTLDSTTFTATFSTNQLSAGTHSITATFSGDRIFDVSPSAASTLTINLAALTITANDATKILNAPNPSFTASYSGFVLGQGPSALNGVLICTTTALANSFVGSYPITCSGQTSTNYAITYVPGTLHIIFLPGGIVDGEASHVVLSPLGDGSSVFKAGRTVPVKFRVGDVNNISIGTPGTVTSFLLTSVITGTVSTPVDILPTSTTPDTTFRFDPTAQQWIFNLNTSGLAPGSTYVFTIGLADGSSINFQFGLR